MLLETRLNQDKKCIWHYEVLPYLNFKGVSKINLPKEADSITEIRIRAGHEVILRNHFCEWYLFEDGSVKKIEFCGKSKPYIVSCEEIERILNIISQNSIYAFQDSIASGFITLKGGHRVGIVGKAVVENGKIVNLSDFSSLNFRICREVRDCAKKVMKYIRQGSNVFNTLIVSPPGCGKTTVLRDIARILSDGDKDGDHRGLRIGIVDERSEIAATIKGIQQLDVGRRSDVLDSCPKEYGINILLRSMSPDVIITDEIGTQNDFCAIKKSVNSGVKIIATYHGNASFEDKIREDLEIFLKNNIFDRIVNLSNENGPGTLEEVFDTKTQKTIYKRC